MNEKELKTIDEIALEFLNGCKKALELERKIMNLQETEETEYSDIWNIDPIDRAWFISPRGDLYSDLSHRLILKNKYSEKWNELKARGVNDGEIEEIFTNSWIQSSYVKIGELDGFYARIYELDKSTKDIIQGFCKSILKVKKDSGDSLFIIHFGSNKTVKSTIKELANGYLFSSEIDK